MPRGLGCPALLSAPTSLWRGPYPRAFTGEPHAVLTLGLLRHVDLTQSAILAVMVRGSAGQEGCMRACFESCRQGLGIPETEVVAAAPVPDLLGSILTGQSILMMDSSEIVINRDGSLKAIKPGRLPRGAPVLPSLSHPRQMSRSLSPHSHDFVTKDPNSQWSGVRVWSRDPHWGIGKLRVKCLQLKWGGWALLWVSCQTITTIQLPQPLNTDVPPAIEFHSAEASCPSRGVSRSPRRSRRPPKMFRTQPQKPGRERPHPLCFSLYD